MRRLPLATLATLAGLGLLSGTAAHAQPFGVFDARSAGMGGVGVATGARYATFNNPSLLVTASDEQEWFLMIPGVSRRRGDSNDLQANLDSFQQAADRLDADPTPANADTVQASLAALEGGMYREGGNGAILLAVPSRILSGAAYMHVYDWSNARTRIAGDDLGNPADPQYASRIEYRGARVLENGISAAKVIGGTGWRRQMAVGFNFKFLFVEGYGYSEGVRGAKLGIDRGQRYSNGSAFNLDLGLLKEFGVWKLGLMGKNLFSSRFEYGDTGEYFKISPQLRGGIAYQSRRTVFELDMDLMRNEAAGFDGATQMISLGTEFKPIHWLALRAGYQQNITGSRLGSASLGMGLAAGFLTFDLAGTYGKEELGAYAQLGLQF